jgi:hypothetical protein
LCSIDGVTSLIFNKILDYSPILWKFVLVNSLTIMNAIPNVLILTLAFMLTVILISQCQKDEPIPIVTIPDNNFLSALIELGIDTDGDGQISNAEAEALSFLDVSGTYEASGEIQDLTGIKAFINLDSLDCGYNQLTSLDISNNTALEWLICWSNQLTSLDISQNTALRALHCGSNPLNTLDVSNNTALEWLICWRNQLTSLDVSNNAALQNLNCYDNQLTSLDISNNTALTKLRCVNNQLTTLDVTSNINLIYIWCGGNQLTTLDISNNTSLGIGAGYYSCYLKIENMPSLEQVCVWTLPFPPEDLWICAEGSPNVYFTTECSE